MPPLQPMSTKAPPEPERKRRTVATFHGPVLVYEVLSERHRLMGQAMRIVRTHRKLSLREASEMLGIGVVDYSECERGVRELDYGEAFRRLGGLHVSPDPHLEIAARVYSACEGESVLELDRALRTLLLLSDPRVEIMPDDELRSLLSTIEPERKDLDADV